MQASTIYATATTVVLLFFLACTGRKERDFGFLIDQTASNKEEVRKMVTNYLRASSEEEKAAYAYILTHLQDQYRIHFQLEKAGKTTPLDGNIGMDSVLSLQSEGFSIDLRDTLRDLDILTAVEVQKHVKRFVDGWNSPWHGNRLPFPIHLRHALPYRTNNEPPEVVFRANDRYSLPDLIRQNAAKDTVERIRGKVATIAKRYSGKLHGVNFLNTSDPKKLLARDENALFTDHEDRSVFEAGLLRPAGLPAVAVFCPHRRHGANLSYAVHVLQDEQGIDNLKVESAAKVYVSSFEASDWDNPFDRLLALGVEKDRIPLSLYVPKMKDITERATATGEIRYSISSQTTRSMNKPVAYLCTYSLGKWLPIDFSIVSEGMARFSNIGTNVLYIICTYAEGRLQPVSCPIVLDEGKGQYEITGRGIYATATTLVRESYNKLLRENKVYGLYVWTREAEWVHLRNFTAGDITDVPKDMLCLVKTKEDSFFGSRPFTLIGNEQVWW